MAIMIPAEPKDVPKYSLEALMFDALKKLSDDYYVVHSFKMVYVKDGIYSESEADFVIFHPQKGLLCIEAKAGGVSYRDGEWYYSSGRLMKNPFRQADSNKWKIKELFEKNKMDDLLKRCKLLHAVWFPSISRNYLLPLKLPAEADKSIILTKEALENPEPFLENIFSIELSNNIQTNLNKVEVNRIINNIICPNFNLVMSVNSKLDFKRKVFNRLLKEQVNILNYLEDQRNAVINGVAGSGKTMIALEKARRHAEKNEKVLFLCFNKMLCDHLRENHSHVNISYYTIDGFACRFCNTSTPDYDLLLTKLMECYDYQSFPYQHIIIDEGQDFGQERFVNIIEALEMLVIDNDFNHGTFYLFYDKNQLVQGFNLPDYISNADCKLTLYKNCRNTKNIAITSTRPLGQEKPPKVLDGNIEGPSPEIYMSKNSDKQREYVNQVIKKLLNNKINDIVILTCRTEEQSILHPYINDGYYEVFNKKIRMTTCRKFKGLEADAVILIDVYKEDLINQGNLVFYVGASRARFHLYMISDLNQNDCNEIINYLGLPKRRRPEKAVATYLNAYLCEYDKHSL